MKIKFIFCQTYVLLSNIPKPNSNEKNLVNKKFYPKKSFRDESSIFYNKFTMLTILESRSSINA